jgi:hypothetical protein
LLEANAEEVDLAPESVDAVLSFYTHDIMSSRRAVERAVRALRPGGRVVASGSRLVGDGRGRLVDPITRAYAGTAITRPLTVRPWQQLEDVLGPLSIEEHLLGSSYVAYGVRPSRTETSGPAEACTMTAFTAARIIQHHSRQRSVVPARRLRGPASRAAGFVVTTAANGVVQANQPSRVLALVQTRQKTLDERAAAIRCSSRPDSADVVAAARRARLVDSAGGVALRCAVCDAEICPVRVLPGNRRLLNKAARRAWEAVKRCWSSLWTRARSTIARGSHRPFWPQPGRGRAGPGPCRSRGRPARPIHSAGRATRS